MTVVSRLPDLSPGGRLANVTVHGHAPAPLSLATTTGKLTLSTSEVSSIELTVLDPDLSILASGVFAKGAPLHYADLAAFEVTSLEVNDDPGMPVLVIDALSEGAQRARAQTGGLVRRGLSRTDYVRIGAAAVGLGFVGQPSSSVSSITRAAAKDGNPGETEYDVWQRLAGEVGYICFESQGVVYFGKPTWLVANLPQKGLHWGRDSSILHLPRCRVSATDTEQPATIEASLLEGLARSFPPGVAAVLDGVPTFTGSYLVTSLEIPFDDVSPCTVQGATPVDPAPQPPPKDSTAKSSTKSGGSSSGTSSSGGGSSSSWMQGGG